MQSGSAERETSNREWRRPREFPEGALTPCTPSHLFSSTTPPAYTVQLEWLTWIPWLNSIIIILFLPPLFATKLSWCRSSWFQQNQEAVDWTSSNPPERTQYRQGSMRGSCSTNWNCCLIDAGIHLPVMCPSIWWFLRYLLPSINSLIIIN